MPSPVVGAVGGGLLQASAASKAAKAQSRAAAEDIAFQRETRDIVRRDLSPYRQIGPTALYAYRNMLGLGAAPIIGRKSLEIETIPGGTTTAAPGGGFPMYDTDNRRSAGPVTLQEPTRYRVGGKMFATRKEAQDYAWANGTGGSEWSWQTTPGYEFRLREGQDSINALAGARGGINSGATLKALSRYNQDVATDEFDRTMSRLGGLVDTGMSAAQMSGQASQNAAAGVSNALAARGNAQAAGAIGVGNALGGAINNGIGIWQYQQGLQQPINAFNPATGTGNWWLGTR